MNKGDAKDDWELKDIKSRYEKGQIKLTISSIMPRAGPTYGSTRVTVRADGIKDNALYDVFPDPKCRFGTAKLTVDANYIKCAKAPPKFKDREKVAMDDVCIQCEHSPKAASADIVTLTVSLTGKFDDVASSMPYRYYEPGQVWAIEPRYGPKDGDTLVKVWGKNFLDLGEDFRCNFGTNSSVAVFQDEGFVTCRAPQSDVVGRPMPFSLSMNRQQNTKQKLYYWYYNDIDITKVAPDFGEMGGGTKVTLKGKEYLPFDFSSDIDNQNDTFCQWGTFTKNGDWYPVRKSAAQVLSSTIAECVSPENYLHLDYVWVNMTLNN